VAEFDYAQVHPELRRTARFLPKTFGLHRGLTLPRSVLALAARTGRLRDTEVIRVNGQVSVRVHRPAADVAPGPALLWIHGGGTVTGSAAQDDRFCRKLVNFTDAAVVAVEHRLAPEHPYPAPVEDCYAALDWLVGQPWVDPARIAVGGASAGGGLAAAVAQRARDRGEVDLALQLLVYPMLDDRTPDEAEPRVLWTARDNRLAWRWYLAGADPAEAVPARREDLSGLPPAWIGVGALDLFYDESRRYGERLQDAGVETHLEIVAGAFHVFDQLVPNASVSQRFFAAQVRALRAALGDKH
jgi:acetyl esterase/lipase